MTRQITLKKEFNEKTFEPVAIVYLDELRTDIVFNTERIMDSVVFYGKAVIDEYIIAAMSELQKYDITQEEEKEYKEFFENGVERFR